MCTNSLHCTWLTRHRKKLKETWEGSCRPSRKADEDEDVGSDTRTSPGTTIQPWSQELYDIISHHTITVFSFAINNHLYESIVPPRTLPMPAFPPNPTGTERGHFHLIDCWCVCVVGTTACLHPRWESGSVAKWSSQRGGCRTCETGQATPCWGQHMRAHSVPAMFM